MDGTGVSYYLQGLVVWPALHSTYLNVVTVGIPSVVLQQLQLDQAL